MGERGDGEQNLELGVRATSNAQSTRGRHVPRLKYPERRGGDAAAERKRGDIVPRFNRRLGLVGGGDVEHLQRRQSAQRLGRQASACEERR